MIDCTSLFSDLGQRQRTTDRIIIKAPEYTYLPDGEIRGGWLPKVLRGFRIYEGTARPRRAAIVGCGPGLDALLMLEIFKLETLVLTDIDQKIVDVALENVG